MSYKNPAEIAIRNRVLRHLPAIKERREQDRDNAIIKLILGSIVLPTMSAVAFWSASDLMSNDQEGGWFEAMFGSVPSSLLSSMVILGFIWGAAFAVATLISLAQGLYSAYRVSNADELIKMVEDAKQQHA
jgi:hypothetical protein